ncbi:hypothetical protein TNCV_685531 [Trichonephila clavipes]|nr:hypothetical protein TNCV_685531 [Trichonephila clavipes]
MDRWIEDRDTFDKLSDLIITDQLKPKTPFEFKEYYLDEWANISSPVHLAEKLEEFEDFKRTKIEQSICEETRVKLSNPALLRQILKNRQFGAFLRVVFRSCNPTTTRNA